MSLSPSEFEILSLYLESVFLGQDTPTVQDDAGVALLAIIGKIADETNRVDLQRLGNRTLSLLLKRLTYGSAAQCTSAKLFDRLKS